MAVETPFQSAVDLSIEQIVDSGPANYRRTVRPQLERAARARADARETADAGAVDTQPDRRGVELPVDREAGSVDTTPIARSLVIRRPTGMGAFEFVILSKLRAAQLMRGCRPRVDGLHKATVIAQLEVSAGKVVQMPKEPVANGAGLIEGLPAMLVGT